MLNVEPAIVEDCNLPLMQMQVIPHREAMRVYLHLLVLQNYKDYQRNQNRKADNEYAHVSALHLCTAVRAIVICTQADKIALCTHQRSGSATHYSIKDMLSPFPCTAFRIFTRFQSIYMHI